MFPSRSAVYDASNLDRRISAIRQSMGLVRKLRTSELLIRCGRIPDPDDATPIAPTGSPTNEDVDTLRNPFSFAPSSPALPSLNSAPDSDAKQFDLLCEVLTDLVGFGNHVGCLLQLQVASYQPDRILRLLDRVKSGPVKIVLDPATVVMSGGRVNSLYRDLYQQIGYIRARDAIRDVDGAGVEVALGEGLVDWPELLALLSESQYDGWMSVERAGGDSRADDVRLGVAHICNLALMGRH